MSPKSPSELRDLAGVAWRQDRPEAAKELEEKALAAEKNERENGDQSKHPYFYRTS